MSAVFNAKVPAFVAGSFFLTLYLGVMWGFSQRDREQKHEQETVYKDDRIPISKMGYQEVWCSNGSFNAIKIDNPTSSEEDLLYWHGFRRLDTNHGKTAEIWMSKRYDGIAFVERKH